MKFSESVEQFDSWKGPNLANMPGGVRHALADRSQNHALEISNETWFANSRPSAMLICYICDRFIETNSYKTNILVGNRYTPEATIILQLLKLMQMERVAGGVLRYSPLIKNYSSAL